MKKAIILFGIFALLFFACTFDYGENGESGRETPDLIMTNVVYVRVRSSDPVARVQAERAERFESRGVMVLQNASFEQFGDKGNEIDSFGWAGTATVHIQSGDVFMSNGVRLEVESEDIILETINLSWLDESKNLSSGSDDEVIIFRENGTNFTGIGLNASVRNHSWEFSGNVAGTFISDDEDEEDTEIVREPVVHEPLDREPDREPLGREPINREPVQREQSEEDDDIK